jgi:hypothetical protein
MGACVAIAVHTGTPRQLSPRGGGGGPAQVEPHNTHWGTFVTILLWSTAGFDLVGACAGEVHDPGETFPAAMTFAMGLTLVIDILSVVVGMSLVRDYASWHDGTFMDVASEVRLPLLLRRLSHRHAVAHVRSPTTGVRGWVVRATSPGVDADMARRAGRPRSSNGALAGPNRGEARWVCVTRCGTGRR